MAVKTEKRPVRFAFPDEVEFDGFTDGSCWNGFDNIWVTPDTFNTILSTWEKNENDDEREMIAELREQTPDADGLYSFAYGFATQVIDPEEE